MTNITIPALDGHPLAATLFEGENKTGPVVVISSGTAIPRRFYRHFAAWLIERGAGVVLTWDYRGISDSWPQGVDGDEKSVRKEFKYLISDWARLDFPAVIDWLKVQYPDRPLYAVGHSFGGQAFGLSDRNAHVDKSVMIASMSGYWRGMDFPEKYKVWALFSLAGPVVGRIFGYIPGRFGLSEDMSHAAFAQWGRWCKSENYFFDDPEIVEVENFGKYRGPILAIGFDDDPWATANLIDHLVGHFNNARLERRQFSTSQAGGKVDHFGFFKPQFKSSLWPSVGDWLFGE